GIMMRRVQPFTNRLLQLAQRRRQRPQQRLFNGRSGIQIHRTGSLNTSNDPPAATAGLCIHPLSFNLYPLTFSVISPPPPWSTAGWLGESAAGPNAGARNRSRRWWATAPASRPAGRKYTASP